MSNHRTACPFHQKWLNTHDTSTDLHPSQKHAAAATRIYTKSLNADTNKVYSNRLGISYNTQLTVRRKNHPKAPDNTFVYTKKLFNYNVNVSSPSYPYNPSTLKKQLKRRNRLTRLLMAQEDIPVSAVNLPQLLNLFPLPYSWHRNIRHKQLTDPIEFEEIILSDQDLKSTWLGPSTSSQLSTTPLKTGSSQNETTYFDSFRNPIPPVQMPLPLPPALDSKYQRPLNPMYQRQLEIRAKKKAQKEQRRQQGLAIRQRAEAEAANRRLIYNAFKLRVRNVFGYPRPPLISMLNAS
ncbi:hypothetical protein C1645_822836, partial [Glomus cerebriforme]